MDVEDAEPRQPVGIVTFASRCEKTYAIYVDDAYMMEFELQKDLFVETANSSDQQKTNMGQLLDAYDC